MSTSLRAAEAATYTGASPLRFHQGQALLRIANTYPTLFDAIMEIIQNAIDVNAANIWLTVDFKNRRVVVQDDGDGASPNKFGKALTQVCKTTKPRDKLGRFGIGLISPLGKCVRFTFTSTPRQRNGAYVEWMFDSAAIVEIEGAINIPHRDRQELMFGGIKPAKDVVPWRSEMRVEQFKRDSALTRVTQEMLVLAVQERYSRAMHRRSSVVHGKIVTADGKAEHFEIRARKYAGDKLPVYGIAEKNAWADFILYLAPRTRSGYRGKVSVGEVGNDFRFEFSQFLKAAPLEYFDETAREGAKALSSGLFEGEVISGKVRINPDRKSFAEGDGLAAFCKAIGRWYREAGAQYVEEVSTARRQERYQEIGVSVVRAIEALVRENALFSEILDSFGFGTQGLHHAKLSDVQEAGDQAPSIEAHSANVERAERDDDERREYSEPEEAKEGHRPFSVLGPHGRKRLVVKGDSLGLQLAYEGLEGSMRLWELDTKHGLLMFNTRHPIWARCEEGGDAALARLQEIVVVWALHLEMESQDTRPTVERGVEDMLRSYVFLLAHGDELAGRKTIKRSIKRARH